MRKTLQLLSRIVLTLGVLLALTPCSACQMDKMGPSSICHMAAKSGKMNCCHPHKATPSFCKVMNQSTVSPSSAPAVTAAVPAVYSGIPVPRPVGTSFASSTSAACFSPPRGPLALRI